MNTVRLPRGYQAIKKIDLVKDQKAATAINILSLVIIVVMVLIGIVFSGVDHLSMLLKNQDNKELMSFIGKVAAAVVFCGVYIVIHELIHAVFMKSFCHECSIKFGYKVIYAYAGSNAYFNKFSYCLIAVSPLIIAGLILAVLCQMVSEEWFWTVYVVEIFNFSGAAGDIYTLMIMKKLPDDILIRDTGVSMTIYAKK